MSLQYVVLVESQRFKMAVFQISLRDFLIHLSYKMKLILPYSPLNG